MKPIFKPQDESHVEKEWVADDAACPDGWHLTKDAALAAWKAPAKKAPKD